MSLITRCPACQTLFKVVPDQLRISEGWVRCGQCSSVFDASLHLLPSVPQVAQHTDTASTLEIEPTANVPSAPDEGQEAPQQISVNVTKEDEYAVPPPAPEPEPEPEPEPILLGPAVVAPPPEAAAHIAVPDDTKAVSDAALDDVSFLRDKHVPSLWTRPLMRATLGVFALVLILGLAVQMVVHERDRIVAFKPELSSWLMALCEPLNCTLSPWRHIESIVIESSSFTRLRADAYRLSFTLKNTAAVALAVPALELTLTDTLDQPNLRRVLMPQALEIQSNTLAAGAEWPVSVAVTVKAVGDLERVAGYRLLAFYP